MKDLYLNIDKKIEKICIDISLYMTNISLESIKVEILKAYEYTKISHEGQKRLSGEPYLIHPVEAVQIMLSLKPDLYTIQACLLHDIIEDTDKTKEDIENLFGKEVAFLCEGVSKLSVVRYEGEDRNIGNLRKMFIAMSNDLRVIFIKLSDRLHNMQTLKYHIDLKKRKRISLETLNIYSPIADRLGLYKLKNSLDKECLKILEPNSYNLIVKELFELKNNRESFTKNAKKEINKLLDGNIQNYIIDFRIKSIYSIYKKMKRKNLSSIKNLYDLFGIRIVVQNISDCYKVLGLIHSKWVPLPNRFKDYMALPKPNGYKSIHTTIMSILKEYRKQPTEIQIKTITMHEYANIGVAAHFEYKEKGSVISKEIHWVNELKEIINLSGDNDFIGNLKIDIFKDRIYVFTPKGDLINLPYGSTVIDFAYYVHTDLGNHIISAKVNNYIYPLDKGLHNGDIIDIIIDKNKKVNPLWVGFVKTLKAKNGIKYSLKKEDTIAYIERGKDIINKYFEKIGLNKLDKTLSILKNFDGVVNDKESRMQILEHIGNFSINPSLIIKKILKFNKIKVTNKKVDKKDSLKQNKIKKSDNKIIIGGEKNLKYFLGKCYSNNTIDEIVAYINSKSIITIHKRNCKTLKNIDQKRLLSAYIEGYDENLLFVNISFSFEDKIGILRDLTEIIASMSINIDDINVKKIGKKTSIINLILIILDYDYLIIDRFIERVKLKFGKDLVSLSVGNIKKNKE